jgi:hypothetical protein
VTWTRRETLIAFAAVTVVWAIALSVWPLSGLVVPWDSKTQFYAFFRFLGRALEGGGSPIWNPYHYMGHPSVADPQSLVLHPGFRALALIAPEARLELFDALVYAHLLAGMLGMLALGRHLGWHPIAAVLAAIVFGLGGSAAARVSHTGIILGYGLFPVALWLLWRTLDRISIGSAIAFALVASLMALGRDQVAIMLCLALVAAGLARLLVPGQQLQKLGLLALIALVGAATLAAPILLTMEFAGLSNRPEIAYATAAAGSLHPVNIATLFAPDVFGSLSAEEGGYFGPDARSRPWVDTTDRTVNYLFAGTFPALLLFWAGLGRSPWQSPGARFAGGMLVVATIYALGWFTPVYKVLFEAIPGVSLFRRPADATFVMNAAIAILCGTFGSHVAAKGWPSFNLLRAAAFALILIAIATSALWFASFGDGEEVAALNLALAAALLVACLGLFQLAGNARMRMGALLLVTGFTAGELVWRNTANALNAEPRANYAVLEDASSGRLADALKLLEAEITRAHRIGERPRVEVLGLGGAAQNIAMVRGLEAINGYNPLRLAAVDRLLAPGQNNHEVGQRRFPESFPSWDSALAKRVGLTWLLLGTRLHKIPAARVTTNADLRTETPGTRLYQLQDVGPRTRLERGGTALITDFRTDRVVVTTHAEAATTLVMADPYYPGWVARIDGVEVEIATSDGLDRRIVVPAGKSSVVLSFEPLAIRNLIRIAGTLIRR